jgi:hypothetical protein
VAGATIEAAEEEVVTIEEDIKELVVIVTINE